MLLCFLLLKQEMRGKMEEITLRFEIIRLAVELGDFETIQVQCKKLRSISLDDGLDEIIELLESKNYRQALYEMKRYHDSLEDEFFKEAEQKAIKEVEPKESVESIEASSSINNIKEQESSITPKKIERIEPDEEPDESFNSLYDDTNDDTKDEHVLDLDAILSLGNKTSKAKKEESVKEIEDDFDEDDFGVGSLLNKSKKPKESKKSKESKELEDEEIDIDAILKEATISNETQEDEKPKEVKEDKEKETLPLKKEVLDFSLDEDIDDDIEWDNAPLKREKIDILSSEDDEDDYDNEPMEHYDKDRWTQHSLDENSRNYPPISYIEQKYRNMIHQFAPVEPIEEYPPEVIKMQEKIALDGYREDDIDKLLESYEEYKKRGKKAEAASVLLLAAATESKFAQFLLARELYKGEVIQKDNAESFTQINTLAEQNFPDAICDLAQFYEHGVGIGKDRDMALLLYEEAAEMGVERAKRHYQRLKESQGLKGLIKKFKIGKLPKLSIPKKEKMKDSTL